MVSKKVYLPKSWHNQSWTGSVGSGYSKPAQYIDREDQFTSTPANTTQWKTIGP